MVGGGWEESRGHLQGFNDDRDSSSSHRSAAKGINGSEFVCLFVSSCTLLSVSSRRASRALDSAIL